MEGRALGLAGDLHRHAVLRDRAAGDVHPGGVETLGDLVVGERI